MLRHYDSIASPTTHDRCCSSIFSYFQVTEAAKQTACSQTIGGSGCARFDSEGKDIAPPSNF